MLCLSSDRTLVQAAKPLITETVYRRQKHPFSLAAGDHGSNGTVPSNDAGRTPRSRPRVAIVLRSEEGRRLLDQLPAMSDSDGIGWDPVLRSVLSACVICERLSDWALV